jgi:hypothetical protein
LNCHILGKQTLVGAWVLLIDFSNPFQELLCPPLLEETHQRRSKSFTRIGRHLGDCGLGAASLLDIAARNLLEIEVSRNVGGDEDVCQFSIGHQQFWYEVDIPVICPSILLPGFFSGANVAILLEQLWGIVS